MMGQGINTIDSTPNQTPDVTRGLLYKEKIFFTSFRRVGSPDAWLVTAKKEYQSHLGGEVEISTTVYRGHGIAWYEIKDSLTLACPPDIYNALNANISVFTASERGGRP